MNALKQKHPCKECNKTYGSLRNLQRHINVKHPEPDDSIEPTFAYKCLLCEETYHTKAAAKNHSDCVANQAARKQREVALKLQESFLNTRQRVNDARDQQLKLKESNLKQGQLKLKLDKQRLLVKTEQQLNSAATSTALSLSCEKDIFTQLKEIKQMMPTSAAVVNNNFNIQVFLNEKCDKAMNINEFIDNINITIQDMDLTYKHGLGESIKQHLITGLNEMKVEERPVHCSNIGACEMYVRDNDLWRKDSDNRRLKESIVKLGKNHINIIPEWEKANDSWKDTGTSMTKYMDMVEKVIQPIEAKDLKKVVTTVAKATHIN